MARKPDRPYQHHDWSLPRRREAESIQRAHRRKRKDAAKEGEGQSAWPRDGGVGSRDDEEEHPGADHEGERAHVPRDPFDLNCEGAKGDRQYNMESGRDRAYSHLKTSRAALTEIKLIAH
jgi:hypothetical protein